MSSRTIAVLGAGPMGLAVAYQLVRDGHRPVVFEADDRVGGMSASFDFGGTAIERYYHFHCMTDVAFFELLDELGLGDRLKWVTTTMSYYVHGRLEPWGTPWALLRFRGLDPISKLRTGLHAFASSRREEWRDLDGVDAQRWMRGWVGEAAWELLWKRLFDLKFHHYADDLSAAWIWSRIRRIGRSRDRLFRERLGYLEGGSDTLLHAMRDAIVRGGGEIRLRTRVTNVAIEHGAVRGVVTADGEERFDRVVSTIPLPYVPGILGGVSDEILDRYRSVQYLAVVCVILKLRKPVTSSFWLNIADPAMDIPGVIEYTNLRPLDRHIVYAPYYVPADHPIYLEDDASIIARVTSYLKTINPELVDDDFVEARASRYRFAQPICPPNFSSVLPPIRLPIDGLFVADTSFYYPEDRGISESIGLGRSMARMATDAGVRSSDDGPRSRR